MTRGGNGVVYPAGLRVRPRAEARAQQQVGGLYRAVVINTYVSDEAHNPDERQVFCDVVLLRTQQPLPMVPVAGPAGVVSAQSWVPKATTKTLSGAPLHLTVFDRKGIFQGDATSYEDMDGDMVLVQFVEGSRQFPMITGRFTHQSTKRKVISGNGWLDGPLQDEQRGVPQKHEMFVRHGGTEARINSTGDVLVDTVGATDDDLLEVPNVLNGEVRLRLKRGKKLVVAAGSVSGQGGAGGAEMLSVTQDAVGNITIEMNNVFRLFKPAVGPATLSLLSLNALQPFVRGLALQTALTGLTAALTVYTAAPGVGTPANPVLISTALAAAGVLNNAIGIFATQLTAALSQTIKGE